MKNTKKGAAHPAPRVRGWDIRTTEERRNRIDADADNLNVKRTRYIEAALDMFHELSRAEKLERMQKCGTKA